MKIKLTVISLLILLAAALVITILLVMPSRGSNTGNDEELNMPRNYKYGTVVASNGMELHYIRTHPSNIKLEAIHNNVVAAPYYGINGGFFYQDALLSIAVEGDVPVNKAPGQYGAGEVNAKYARGTLVWDAALNKFSVQVVRHASEIAVTDRSRFWAQGGISMSLDQSERWMEQTVAEAAPLPDADCLRSAAVYDTDGEIYLVVSATKGTLAEFREAIVERVGDGKLVNGIFLDGDGSSQLRSREVKLSGDGRPVVQMLRLVE